MVFSLSCTSLTAFIIPNYLCVYQCLKQPRTGVPELVTRPACFYPIETHRDYITLRGIAFLNVAPNWGTANGEQVGVVGTNWSRGWVIEDCEVSGSSCDGITLGKFGDEYDNSGPFLYCYYDTIKRAASNGWDRVGHHVVRRCKVPIFVDQEFPAPIISKPRLCKD